MSLPSYRINCTECGYESVYNFRVWYEFEEGRDSIYSPKLEQGWCEDCQNVVTIATSYADEDIEKEIARYKGYLNEINIPSTIEKFFRLLLPSSRNEYQRRKTIYEKRIEEQKQRKIYFSNLDFVNRCMVCEGESVTLIHMPHEVNSIEPIGAKHCCGGELEAYWVYGIHFGGGPKVIYDREANILSDERKLQAKTVYDHQSILELFVEESNSQSWNKLYCLLDDDVSYVSDWNEKIFYGKMDVIQYLKERMKIIITNGNPHHTELYTQDEESCALIFLEGESNPSAFVFIDFDGYKITKIRITKEGKYNRASQNIVDETEKFKTFFDLYTPVVECLIPLEASHQLFLYRRLFEREIKQKYITFQKVDFYLDSSKKNQIAAHVHLSTWMKGPSDFWALIDERYIDEISRLEEKEFLDRERYRLEMYNYYQKNNFDAEAIGWYHKQYEQTR